MMNCEWTPEFDKEFRRLKKKFRSLDDDIKDFEDVLVVYPTGVGTKFTIVHDGPKTKVVKARLACRSLRDSSLRIVYAWHKNMLTFVYLELYHKGEKENENRERIKDWLKSRE